MTSPHGELRVIPSHLRKLSERQSEAVEQMQEAAPVTAEEADAVLRSHGNICLSTYFAAQAAAKARIDACTAMQVMSESFAVNLETAAAKYSHTDQQSGRKIDGKMGPRFS